MAENHDYNPWRRLRLRDDIELRWGVLPDTYGGGVAIERDGQLFVVLDSRLDRIGRRSVLEHELQHLDRGLLPVSCPEPIREKDELAVRRQTAKQLVPLTELRAFISRRCSVGEAVTVRCVADHFDVSYDVARDACELAS